MDFVSSLFYSASVASDPNTSYRGSMEDTHAIIPDFASIKNSGYFAIFDGHGGKQAATEAGANFHIYLEPYFSNNLKDVDQLSSSISNAYVAYNEELCEILEQITTGTTALTVFFYIDETDDNIGHILSANLGDSQAILTYQDDDGSYALLSTLHSCQNDPDYVIEHGGRISGERVDGILTVTRAFGDKDLKQYLNPKPSIWHESFSLRDPPHSLILACDGLWDVCSFQKAAWIVQNSQDPTQAAQSLVNYALENETTDNISCIVVFFTPLT